MTANVYVPPWILLAAIAALIWLAVGVLELQERRRDRRLRTDRRDTE